MVGLAGANAAEPMSAQTKIMIFAPLSNAQERPSTAQATADDGQTGI